MSDEPERPWQDCYREPPRKLPSGMFGVLSAMRDHFMETARERGYFTGEPDEEIGAAVANLHEEVSELWRAWRKGVLDYPCDKAEMMREYRLAVLTSAEEEIADIIIRALELAALVNVQPERAIYWKDWLNQLRPGRGNGGRRV